MQAYLQYRRIGQAVQKQIDEYPELSQLDTDPGTPDPASPEATIPENGNETKKLPPGVTLQTRMDGNTGICAPVYMVDWTDDDDPLNPLNYTLGMRIAATMNVTALAFIVGAASSIQSGVLPQNAAAFGVSHVVASLATGIYLLGFGTGSLVSGPLSEILGRNAVYAGSLTIFMIFVMASGLAPNIGAQLAFRFLAGVFGCPPLTCAGGTVADLWKPLEKTLVFPVYAILSFGGPVLGPVIASWMGQGVLSWRWTNWIILIGSGLIMATLVLFQPETYSHLILKWKAQQLRAHTGNARFRAEMELEKTALMSRMAVGCLREFQLTVHEPIVLLISLYMTIIYIVLFTFFDGYEFIFSDVHGLSQGLTNIVWVAMYTGIMLAGLLVPVIYRWTKKEFLQAKADAGGDTKAVHTRPENRLWFAMMGCPFIPIGLFWMGWTDYVCFLVLYCFLVDRNGRETNKIELDLDLVSYRGLRGLRVWHHYRVYLELHVHHRFVQHLRCVCAGLHDCLAVYRSRRNDRRGSAVLSEHGRSLYLDHFGVYQCCHDSRAVCVLSLRACYSGLE